MCIDAYLILWSPEKGDKGLVSKIVRCLVWQATCRFPQKSNTIFVYGKYYINC